MKTLRYIALAAMTLSFAACTQEEDFTPQMDGDAVKINATIGAMQTRVAYGENGVTNFVNGDAFKVVNTMRSTKNEATYTTTDGTNWTTTDAMVWNSTSKNKFQAWYPVAEYSSYDAFTIPTDQSDAAKLASADWMTASTEEIDKPGNGVLDLNFQHRLAKVTVNLTFSSQYPEGYQHVSDFTFYTNEETRQAITPLANSETSYTAILCPGEYADEDDFIYLEMDNFDEHYVLGKTTTSAINLEAGKHYTFTLKVGKDVVSIDDVTVADWNEEEIDGGVAEEVIPNEYDATTNTYKVYQGEYLQTAIDEAELTGKTENPATVKIMRDMEVTGIPNVYDVVEQDLLMDAGEIVLDLNGHTLTGKTGLATINIDNGAKLTIDDSSESKSGKIQNLSNDAVYVCDGSTLVVNNGTFEGKCAVFGSSSPTIVINGGTFKATNYAIEPQDANLTITGGTFEGEALALSLSNYTQSVLITGGSFTGRKYDIYTGFKTGFLSFNDDGVGPSFPGGLSIKKDRDDWTLNSLLAEGAGYYVGEELQTLDDNAASCEGDVTVKKIPTYEYDATSNIYTVYQGEYLQTAFDEAEQTGTAESPATVKIMKDMTVVGESDEHNILVDAGVIILDLNGRTITGSGAIVFNLRQTNSATLTIDDSSENKSGKIVGIQNAMYLICVNSGSTLIVNNGTFEGTNYGVYSSGETASNTINGGTFKSNVCPINAQNSSLTITGGTFEGGTAALDFTTATNNALITGGCFTGGKYDIDTSGKTGFLSYNADGVGPTFPGGLSIYVYTNCPTLTDLLANGAAYYDSSGNQLTLADATSCEGDVTVKKIPTDE